MKVAVTSQLVQYALQQTNSRCAIALAIKDASDDFVLPRVDQKTIRVTDRRTGKRYIFNTPEKIAKWIDNFDRNRELVEPIRFDLNLEDADEVKPMRHMDVHTAIAQTQRDHARRDGVRKANPGVASSKRELR